MAVAIATDSGVIAMIVTGIMTEVPDPIRQVLPSPAAAGKSWVLLGSAVIEGEQVEAVCYSPMRNIGDPPQNAELFLGRLPISGDISSGD